MADKKEKRKYDRALLEECLKRDGATLVGEYEKLTRNSKIEFICKCGLNHTKIYNSIINGKNGIICKKCERKNTQIQMEETCLLKYGYKNPSQNNSIKEKKKNTLLNHYGVENPLNSKEILDKVHATNTLRYGGKTPSSSKSVVSKMQNTCLKKYGVKNPTQNNDIKHKVKQTNIERYGVECIIQNKLIREKVNKTILTKYGVDHPLKNKNILEKVKETNIKKYGTSCSMNAPEIQEKIKASNIIKYGVEYPNQNPDVFEKAQKNAKKFKEYKMPSGTIRKVQGYEPFALDALLKEYTEDQILTDRKDVGRIPYKDGEKQRYYFPDIKIPHLNKVIEVKSTWTYKCKTDNIELKAAAAKEKGYDYELWIFNAKGERVFCET